MTRLARINRRGACPALSAPMQTGDGLLVRLNPVPQGLTPNQLIGLCDSAGQNGNGILEITARGSLQIRGLAAETVPRLAKDVDRLAIEVRTGMPVDISPLAGLDPAEIADPRPIANAIRAAAESVGMSSRLGPKVSVVVDAGGQIDLSGIAADIRLVAGRRRTGSLWRIACGGTAMSAEPMGAGSEASVAGFVLDLLEQIAALGRDARGVDLVQAGAGMPKDGRPAWLPSAPSRSGGEVSPEGRRRGGGQTGRTGAAHDAGILPLSDSRLALPIALPFGQAQADALAALAKAAGALGVSDLRFAPDRRLLALCPDAAAANRLAQHAAALDFIIDPDDPRLAVSACAGAPACASGLVDTKALAAELAAGQQAVIEAAGDVHVSGCAKGCAHPAPAGLTLVGCPDGVGLVVDGTARDAPLIHAERTKIVRSLPTLLAAATGNGDASRPARP